MAWRRHSNNVIKMRLFLVSTHFFQLLPMIEIWLWPFTILLLTPHTAYIWKTDIWKEFKWNSFVCPRSEQHKNVSGSIFWNGGKNTQIKLCCDYYIISETNKTVWSGVWTSFWPLQSVSQLGAVFTHVWTRHAGLGGGDVSWNTVEAQLPTEPRRSVVTDGEIWWFSAPGSFTPCWAEMQRCNKLFRLDSIIFWIVLLMLNKEILIKQEVFALSSIGPWHFISILM